MYFRAAILYQEQLHVLWDTWQDLETVLVVTVRTGVLRKDIQ